MIEGPAALDCVTLIHALKEMLPNVPYSEREREMARRAKILMHLLDAEGRTLVVPAVVVAEYLAGITPEYHEVKLAEFRETFEIPPFDIKAVSIAAKLWQVHRVLPKADQLERIVLKADILILLFRAIDAL